MKKNTPTRNDFPGIEPKVAPVAKHSGTETIGLNSLLGILNDPERAPVEGGSSLKIPVELPESEYSEQSIESATLPKTLGTPAVPTPVKIVTHLVKKLQPSEAVTPKTAATAPSKIFFTGRIGVGKDWLAHSVGAKVFGLADPIYALAQQLFNISVNSTEGKAIPEVREALQKLGQYGRGTISPQYPLTLERALIVSHIRAIGPEIDYSVDWPEFGTDENIWLDSCLRRVESANLPFVAITNVRFPNEFRKLVEQGWRHYHVMCSEATISSRRGNAVTPAATNDVSETLAIRLDADVDSKIKQSAGKQHTQFRAIWNDATVARPSQLLLTTSQFQSIFKKI